MKRIFVLSAAVAAALTWTAAMAQMTPQVYIPLVFGVTGAQATPTIAPTFPAVTPVPTSFPPPTATPTPGTPTATPMPTATSTPAGPSFTIVSDRLVVNPSNQTAQLYFEARNNLDRQACMLIAEVKFYHANGWTHTVKNAGGSRISHIDPGVIVPGAVWYYPQVTSPIERYEYVYLDEQYPANGCTGDITTPITVVSSERVNTAAGVVVTVTMRNDTDGPTDMNAATVAFYQFGKIYYVDGTYNESVLMPGETLVGVVNRADATLHDATFQVWAQGNRVAP